MTRLLSLFAAAGIAVTVLAAGTAHASQTVTLPAGHVTAPCGWPQTVYWQPPVNQETLPNGTCAWQWKLGSPTPAAYSYTLHPQYEADVDVYFYDSVGSVLGRRFGECVFSAGCLRYCGDITDVMPAGTRRIVVAFNPGCGSAGSYNSMVNSNSNIALTFSYVVP